MFAGSSRAVRPTTKAKLVAAIRRNRSGFELGPVHVAGRRWASDEDCFQGVCQILFGMDVTPDEIDTALDRVGYDEAARLGLANAASADYHYRYEKDWGPDDEEEKGSDHREDEGGREAPSRDGCRW